MNFSGKRIFSEAEDELIRQQPTSGLSVWVLAKMMSTTGRPIERRADELGVTLVRYNNRRSPNSGPRKKWPPPADDTSHYIFNVNMLGPDPLLAALKEGKR